MSQLQKLVYRFPDTWDQRRQFTACGFNAAFLRVGEIVTATVKRPNIGKHRQLHRCAEDVSAALLECFPTKCLRSPKDQPG